MQFLNDVLPNSILLIKEHKEEEGTSDNLAVLQKQLSLQHWGLSDLYKS